VALSSVEVDLIERHHKNLMVSSARDELLWRYYTGQQRVEQLGMAIPPSMRRFLVVANWCRTLVDTKNQRQQVRSLILPGEETADPRLRAVWDASNLSAHTAMFNADRMVYGRAFMSVGSNADDTGLPWVRVESPREMSADVDPLREVVTSACRLYGSTVESPGPLYATLYLPDVTVWAEKVNGKWLEVDRDPHRLGAVPVVMHLNRRMSGQWTGESEMTDIIPIVDAAARSLTNLQFAQEAHGIPRMWMTGVAKGDFVDAQGKPIPQFEAYFDAIHMLTKEGAKVGQLSAADLKNFETALKTYGLQASTVTGFPARYWGITSTNPPTEGAIRADEAQLTRSIEADNEQVGMTLGWVGALAMRFATGDWVPGNRVRVDWFDPATPTVSQREDALAKRRAAGVLSREGYWDELGWSEARKAKEREYLRAESAEAAGLDLSFLVKNGLTGADASGGN
jgi:hypothetical protein